MDAVSRASPGAPSTRRRAETQNTGQSPSACPRPLLAGLGGIASLPLILFALHLAGAAYYFPPAETFGNPPIAYVDYATHFYQAATVTRFWREAGQPWGYDPHLLAGYPLGSVFELNNAGLATGTWLLSFLFDVPLAYNLVILGLFVTLPLIVYAAAAMLDQSPWARSIAVAAALALWYADPVFRHAWSGGTFAFAIASGWALLALAAFIRYLHAPARRHWILLTLLSATTLLIGPQVAITLAVPLLFGYLLSASRLSRRQHLGLIAAAAVVVIANAFWLAPIVRFLDIKTGSNQYLQAGVTDLIKDVAGIGRVDNSPPCRCGLRWLALGLSGWLWLRRNQDKRDVSILTVGALSSFTLAYFGSYLQPLADLQPYRFVIPASLMVVLPAAEAAVTLARHPPRWRTATFAAAAVAAFWIILTAASAWYFRPRIPPLDESETLAKTRISGPPPSTRALMDWISTQTISAGRILINDWTVGALIPYYTRREVIGGPFMWAWIQHGHANAGVWDAFGRDLQTFTRGELQQAMQVYNVQWVITRSAFDEPFFTFDDLARRWPGFLEPVNAIDGFRIYRVPWPPDSFLVGSGRAQATYNQIQVWGASRDGVVLKYHWLPTLRSDPPLPLRPYPVLDDPVGFIQVENGAITDFTIYNGY